MRNLILSVVFFQFFSVNIPEISCLDACSNYTELNYYRRSRYHNSITTGCDGNLSKGWYRFTGAAGTHIATSCVPQYHCGTDAPGWMNGSHPSVHEGTVNRTVCYHWFSSCCHWSNTIQVKNCGAYYVYELDRTPTCSLRYCGDVAVYSTLISTQNIKSTSTQRAPLPTSTQSIEPTSTQLVTLPTSTQSIEPTSTQRTPLPTSTQSIAAVYPTAPIQGVTVHTNCYGTLPSTGRITSPNYPGAYSNYQRCYWLLTASTGTVHIYFEDFATESGYDHVRVYDGSSTSSNQIGSFSGSSLPNYLYSSSNQMYITFSSDRSNTYKGFSLKYYSTVNSTLSMSLISATQTIESTSTQFAPLLTSTQSIEPTSTQLVTLPTSTPAAVYPTAPIQGVTVHTNCHGTLPSTGRITTPNYPGSYSNNQRCYWLLTASTGTVHIYFEDFATESGYDHVRVYDGSSTSSNQIGSFSGSSLPNYLDSSSDQMYITFRSDRSVTYKGFSLKYYSTENSTLSNSSISTQTIESTSTQFAPLLTSTQSIEPTSTQRTPLPTSTPAAVYPTAPIQDMMCRNYRVLTSANRSRRHPSTAYECDYYLTKGWYRFAGAAGTHIATSCVPWNHCNTYNSGWMSGSHPTVGEGIVSRTVYYSSPGTCHSYQNTIRVKNCSNFFVYELDRTPGCHLRYCGNGTGPGTLRTLDFFISLIEKMERLNNNIPMAAILSYIRKLTGYDNAKWTTLLGATNDSLLIDTLTSNEKNSLINMVQHRFYGQLEQGVVLTAYDDVAMGPVITGICAGLSRDRNIWLWQISRQIDNLYVATLAGDLGLTSLVKKIKPSLPLLGPSGVWSPNTQCPQYFSVSGSTPSMATDAQIRGGIDGFLLGYKLPEWNSRGVRLSQLLRMYYQGGVVYDKEFAACRRMETFRKIFDDRDLAEQTTSATYAVKALWNNGLDFSSVPYYEIPQLANDTVQQFYNHTTSFFSRHSCPAPGDDEGCPLSANIVFVLDESGSIGQINYEVEKEFVKKIIGAFEISPYKARVAVVEYEDYAYESIKLEEHSSKSALLCAVDKLTFASGGTATSLALQKVYDILINAQSNVNPNQANDPQIIILLTDGHSNGGISSLRPIVNTIKQNIKGLTMVAVGVGSYNLAELQLIATDPYKHVLSTNDFNQLIGLAQQLKNQTCNTATVLKPDVQSLNTSSYNQNQVTGYVSPGKPRYFKLDSVTIYNVNIRITITSYFGTLIIYGSWNYSTPDEDNHDFKYIAYENQWSSSYNGTSVELNDICKARNASCGLFIALVGGNSSNSCSDLDCSIPYQIKFVLSAVFCSCSNGGTCYTTPSGYNCSCPRGYTGKYCDSLDVCNNYTELSSSDRSRYHPTSLYRCDYYDLTKGWYRYTGAAGKHIATSCVPEHHCNTGYSGWMSGSHPTVEQGIVTRSVCFGTYYRCCHWSNTIRVKNCGGFYVYELDRTPACDFRYCGNGPEGSNCVSGKPCYNGGTCQSSSYRYYCSCAKGYNGRNCETNLMVKVKCEADYMEVSLEKSYLNNTDWRDVQLIDSNCVARNGPSNIVIRAPLDGCGTTHKEDNDTIVFENKIIDNKRHTSSVISRDGTTLLKFHCKYSKRKVVSTSFNASKEIVQISEGNFGNFTFMMNIYKSGGYQEKYKQDEYPVSVVLDQTLWIQYKVINTIGNLVVFAENCRATLSTDPYSTPQYEFLKDGCKKDNTMLYNYDPYSNVQRFSIKSFRFLHTSNRLVYLHCHLMVCHRNSANSRCSQGCIGSRRRRRETKDYDDTSNAYDLSTGPLSGQKIGGETDRNKGSEEKVTGMAISLGLLGGVLIVIGVVVVLKFVILKSRKVGSAPNYELKTNDESASPQPDEPPPPYLINAFDGPAAFQLDELTKPLDLEL